MRWLRGEKGSTSRQIDGYLAMLETSKLPNHQLSIGVAKQRDNGSSQVAVKKRGSKETAYQ
jgi:hypothetical protein